MKILLVHNYYQQRGGEDAVVEAEADLLRGAGYVIVTHFVHNDEIGGLWSKVRTALGSIYSFQAKRRLRAVIREERPDIVHVHNFFPRFSPSIFAAARRARIPTVLTLHNFRIICPTAFLIYKGRVCERSVANGSWWTVPRRVYRGSLIGTLILVLMIEWHKWAGTWDRNVDIFVALTDFAKSKFVDAGLPPSKIIVKPNSTFLLPNASAAVLRKGALFVGRLSEEKGLGTLLSAWKTIDSPLRIVGGGPLRDWVEIVRPPQTTILGSVSRDRVMTEMMMASFLVMPSVGYEMFPMTLAEAYSVGLPVVASSLGGLSELVQDGVTGLLFKAGDDVDLARVVRWALANPERMSEMGKNAYRFYLENLTPDKNASALALIYAEAIQSQHRRGAGHSTSYPNASKSSA